jgi:hypothetical protein
MAALMDSGWNEAMLRETRPPALATYAHEHVNKTCVLRAASQAARRGLLDRDKIGFLSLPVEVRLSIYEYIHAANVVMFPDLAPGYPAPALWEYHVRAVRVDGGEKETSSQDDDKSHDGKMISPYRPYGKMPTALLLANSTVYLEARVIPFHEGEFVFLDWWSSGLWFASAVMGRMARWQLEEMRYVRIQVRWLGDLERGSSLWRWIEQCRRWKDGLRGMRLTILSPWLPLIEWWAGRGQNTTTPVDTQSGNQENAVDEWMWAKQGLGLLRGLRRLEVDLHAHSATAMMKLEWCRELQRVVRDEAGMDMEVVCVEEMPMEVILEG